MDGDNITVLDTQVVADDTVDAGAAIIEVVVGKDDQNGVLSLLATDQHGVATEELEGVHGVVGEGNDRVIIVDGISNPRLFISELIRRFSTSCQHTSAGWASFSF